RLGVTRSGSRCTERRGVRLTRRRGERGVVARSGFVRRESARSSPGSTFMLDVVFSGGIHAHPAAQPAGRGRLHAVNPASPGTNHHITRALNTPRSLRSARKPESTLQTSALSASPCELMLRVSV